MLHSRRHQRCIMSFWLPDLDIHPICLRSDLVVRSPYRSSPGHLFAFPVVRRYRHDQSHIVTPPLCATLYPHASFLFWSHLPYFARSTYPASLGRTPPAAANTQYPPNDHYADHVPIHHAAHRSARRTNILSPGHVTILRLSQSTLLC